MSLLVLFFVAAVVNNYVLVRFLGICSFLGVSRELSMAWGMGLSVTWVMTLASFIAYFLDHLFLRPWGLEYLRTVVFITVIAALVQLVEIALRRLWPNLYGALGLYLPLITTNCAVLGVTLLNAGSDATLPAALVSGLGGGLGYLLALLLLAGVRERLRRAELPARFLGLPATLIAAGLASLAFLGFQGLGAGRL